MQLYFPYKVSEYYLVLLLFLHLDNPKNVCLDHSIYGHFSLICRQIFSIRFAKMGFELRYLCLLEAT